LIKKNTTYSIFLKHSAQNPSKNQIEPILQTFVTHKTKNAPTLQKPYKNLTNLFVFRVRDILTRIK